MSHDFQNINWGLDTGRNNQISSWQMAEIAVAMDIREELKKLNTVFGCVNFTQVPDILREIRTATHNNTAQLKSIRRLGTKPREHRLPTNNPTYRNWRLDELSKNVVRIEAQRREHRILRRVP